MHHDRQRCEHLRLPRTHQRQHRRRLRAERCLTPRGLHPCTDTRRHYQCGRRRHLRERHHAGRGHRSGRRKALRHLRRRGLPHRSRLHVRELPLLRQQSHGQRRGMRGTMRTVHRQPPQVNAPHRRRTLVLQRRVEHQLLQPRLQARSRTLRHDGAWLQDGKRRTHPVARTDRGLLHGDGQGADTPRHVHAPLLVRHRRGETHLCRARHQPMHRRHLPRREQMAQARRTPCRVPHLPSHLRLALTLRRPAHQGWHRHTRGTAGGTGLRCGGIHRRRLHHKSLRPAARTALLRPCPQNVRQRQRQHRLDRPARTARPNRCRGPAVRRHPQ